MFRLQVRLNYMLIFLWQNFVWPTLLSFNVWVINLGLTTLYRPGLATTTFSVSVTVALSSLISPLLLVFGLQPWCVIALHLPSPSCIVVLATTVQTSLMTSVKQRFKNSHMTHSVPLAPFSQPRVWIPLLKKNPHQLLLWPSWVS